MPRMIHTTTSTRALMGRRPASALTHPGLSGRARARKGAHLLMEPAATTSPRGRANTSVSAKISTVVPNPSSRVRVTVQNIPFPHPLFLPACRSKAEGAQDALCLRCFALRSAYAWGTMLSEMPYCSARAAMVPSS